MRGHNAVARELGTVDVIWWTDHDWRIAGHGHIPGFDFEALWGQTFPIPYRDVPGIRHVTVAGIRWRGETEDRIRDFKTDLVQDVVAQGEAAFRIIARSEPDALEWQWAGIVMEDSGGRLRAPLASDVEVELELYPLTVPNANRRFVVRLQLSRQVDGLAELTYVVGDPGPPRLEIHDGVWTGVVPIEAPAGRWNRLVLKVTRDVQQFDLGGLDNSLHVVSIGMQVRGGARAAMVVDGLRVRRLRSGSEVLVWAEEMAARLEEDFGIANHVGLEVSYSDHMNAYLPEIELPDFERHPHGMTAGEVVLWAHARGGVVSYNHVFGAQSASDEEYESRARRLIDNMAFGADLLEVGYPHRGLPLEHHLGVWDELSRKRVVIGGIGTSDSHDQSQHWRRGNNYVTWVWARSPARRDLIKGLRRRQAFFGDPVVFQGEIFLETRDRIPMGSVISTDSDEHEVVLRITDLPRGTTVRWIEDGEVAEVLEPLPGELVRTFNVDTRDYRFVRAEVWRGSRGLAFSNCLYFVPSELKPSELMRSEDP